MNERITIDAALGGVYDRIGFYLTQAGAEDASGARRFCLEKLIKGDLEYVAKWFKVDVEIVIREFGHLAEGK